MQVQRENTEADAGTRAGKLCKEAIFPEVSLGLDLSGQVAAVRQDLFLRAELAGFIM